MSLFKGSGVAMVTPFTKNGINYDALLQHIEHLINGGTNAIIALGTTGEPATQTDKERNDVVKFTIDKVNRRIPVFVGTGSNNTAHAIELSQRAQSLGADGLLIVTPYYNKCTQSGLVAHYKAIAQAVEIPIIAYNVPARTLVNIAPETILRLGEIKNIRAIKDASVDIEHLQAAAAAMQQTGIEMYMGSDHLTVVGSLLGAKGLISVAANCIPKQMTTLCNLCNNGQWEQARKLQFELAPLMKALSIEVNPIPIKKAMQLIGIDAGIPRLPLTEMEKAHADILETALKNALML